MAKINPSNNINIATELYIKKRHVYEQLSKKAESIIREIILSKKIPIHVISSRTKEIDSFSKKCENGKYTDPMSQITDLSGIRIIAYVEDDLSKISNIIESNFDIDPINSIDKSKSLGIDKVGYRSIHYIAKFKSDRLILPEYIMFKGLNFEIQIRTILQHSWAEIEHDKNYKFSGVLPNDLQRRFKILAAVLELADREFNEIAIEIDKYISSVKKDTKIGKLDIEINSTSVKTYLENKFSDLIKLGLKPIIPSNKVEIYILNEFKLFGISSLKNLDEIIPEDYIEKSRNKINNHPNEGYNFAGILRELMMIENAEKYFKECWQHDWSVISRSDFALINSYNVNLEKYMEMYNIDYE